MKLTMLGTGNALVTKIYNTCFVLEDNHQYFMVDAGGGNQILTQLKKAGYDWKDMKHIFLTHKHIDHLLGMVWMMRMITQFMNAGKYEGDAYIYGHDEVIHILKDMADTLLVPKQSALIGKRLHLVEVKDQETMYQLEVDCRRRSSDTSAGQVVSTQHRQQHCEEWQREEYRVGMYLYRP